MAKQDVNIGVEGNDGTGDSIRESFRKVNENFTELYAVFGVGGQITFSSLSDTPSELSANTIPLVNDAGTFVNLVQLASNSAADPDAQDTITFNYDEAGKLIISSAFTKVADDLSPTLGGPIDAAGFGIGNVGISTAAAEALNAAHDNLSGLTVDDLVITKGYADQRYITSGLPLRVQEEPTGQAHYTWTINSYVDNTVEITRHNNTDQSVDLTGHGLESGSNGLAVVFNAEDTDPTGLVSGTTYYIRVVTPTRLNFYTEANKEFATTDIDSDAEDNKVLVSGTIAPDDTHTIRDEALDTNLSGNFLSDTAMPRTSIVRRQGDTMTGNLFLSDHPGELAGQGKPNGDEDLQAATKFYVDNTAYSSPEVLFVSTQGDDTMQGVPPGKEGTSFTYAFKTINKAAERAEELIKAAPVEPGNYMQTLTHTNFTKDSVIINADVDVPVYEQARKLLDNNRDYIANEVVAFVSSNFPDFAYNVDTCKRDTGLIIDAIALDINRGLTANYLTIQAAQSYYSGVSARIAITSQLTETVAGIVKARDIAVAALTNDLLNQKNIQSITVAEIPTLTTTTAHGLSDGDIIVLRDIEGMTQIADNTKKYVKATGTQTLELYNDSSLEIPFDTSSFDGYTGSGILGQVYQIEEDQYFDLGTIITITTTGNVSVTAGETITQAGSGATGIVVSSITNGTTIQLENTTGEFNTGNELTGTVSGALGPDSVPTTVARDLDADSNAVTAVGDKFDLVVNIIQNGLDSGGDIVYGSTYKLVVTNGASTYTDQTNPGNTDALPGKVIRGKRSEAIGQIVSFTNDVGAEAATDPQTGALEPGPTVFQLHLLSAKDFEPEEPLEFGNFVKKKQVAIRVETGIYEEDYPIRLSANVSLKGDEFRRVIIKPKTETLSRVPRVSQSKWSKLYFYRDNEFDGLTLTNGGTTFFNQDGVAQGRFGYHYLFRGDRPVNVGSDISNIGSYTTASNILKENKDYIIEETIRYISDRFPDLTYSTSKCRRDTGLIIDALVADLTNGGEERTLEVQGSYHTLITDGTGDYLTQLGDSTQEVATQAAIDNISTLSNALLAGNAPNYTVVDATFTPTFATYDPLTGILVLTIGSHSLETGQYIEVEPESLTFTCASDGNVAQIAYPRTTDPAFQTKLEITAKTATTITVNVGTSSETSAHTFVSADADAITFGEYTAGSAGVLAIETPDTTLGAGESGTGALVGNLIDKINFVFDVEYNPPKRNDELDVFLMSDATIIRNVTVQGHGGFMCVLDPEGQVLTKSPYIQTASSFSKSINQKTFAGGMYVDAYVGNLPANILTKVNNFQLTVQSNTGEGLRLRPPELPCPFYVEGRRYQVNAIANYDQGQGTATIFLDANSNEGTGYDETQFDNPVVPRSIFFQTAGNRSLLANDFTQINDLGYGLIANNAAFSEQVSTFTYYCQTAMYANNGSEIRGLNCSNGYGNFGLIAEGADPNEIPDQVSTKYDMVQAAKVFTDTTFTNAFDEPSIHLTDLKRPPTANSLITIDHPTAGTLNYVVSTVTNLSDADGDGVIGESGDVVMSGVKALDATSLAGTTATAQTFSEVATSGAASGGTGLTVDVTITGVGVIGAAGAAVVSINTPGSGYLATDTITISGADLGGSTPTNDLTIDVSTVYGTAGVFNNIVYKCDLKADDVQADDFFGTLQETVADGTIIEYRDNFNFIFDSVADPDNLVTRPSTAVNFDESDQTTYRSIAFSNKDSFSTDLAADEILTTFEVGFDFVDMEISTTNLTGGYGSAQGDTKIAITPLTASALNLFDDTERVTRDSSTQEGLYPTDPGYSASGGMRFVWDGKTHGITGYHTVSTLNTTGSITVVQGETLTQANTGATAVVLANTTGSSIEVYDVTGTFNTTDTITGSTSGALGANSVPTSVALDQWAYIDIVDIASTNINTSYGGAGINSAIPAAERTLSAGLTAGSTAEITIAISLLRATGHDFTQIGTGSFNQSNYPNVILGDPVNSLAEFYTDAETATTAQVWERRKGRVFFVSTDQDGFFRVGKFFSVDQSTGDITFAGEIGLSNANALGFKKGVTINEFSADDSFADDSGQAVPTEKAIGGYLNRILGFNSKSNTQIPGSANRIGPGFLPLNGLSTMEANLDMGGFKVQNVDTPASGSDATNKNYVDDNANAFATVKQLRDTSVGTVGSNELTVFTGKQIIYTEPETGGTFTIGDTIQNDPTTPSATGVIVDLESLTDEQFGSIRKIVYTVSSGTFDPDNDTIYENGGSAQAVGLTTPLQADVGGPFSEISHASEATSSDINLTITRTASGTEFDFQIEADSIINADVNSSAAIAQSKLAMNTAGTRANATGISQSDLGLATFKDTEFTETNGFVELQTSSSTTTGIDPSKLQHIATDTVLGRSAAGDGAVSALSFDTVLDQGGALRDSEFGTFGSSGDEVLIRTAANTYSTTEVTTSGENSKIVKTLSDGNIRAQGLVLGGADSYEVATTTGAGTTLQIKTPGQAVVFEAVGTTSESLVTDFKGIVDVGSTGISTESDFQTASSYTGEGFLASDWVYTNFLEAATERGSGSTGIGLGAGGGFTESAADTILFVTSGASAVTIDSSGHLNALNNVDITGTLTSDGLASLDGGIDVDGAFTVANTSGNIATSGTLSVGSTATFNGNVDIGNATSDTITFTSRVDSNIEPDATGNNRNLGASGRKWNTVYASVFDGTATNAQYADLAENYLADAEYEAGTVLVFGGDNEITTTNTKGNTRVAGVVSTSPAHLMNSNLEGEHVTAIALQGRVPCKVLGRVEKGDMLVTSAIPGYAIVNNSPGVGQVIGKAVGAKQDDGKGTVEVVVGRV